jgi:GT2 family glycosyltransferase
MMATMLEAHRRRKANMHVQPVFEPFEQESRAHRTGIEEHNDGRTSGIGTHRMDSRLGT